MKDDDVTALNALRQLDESAFEADAEAAIARFQTS